MEVSRRSTCGPPWTPACLSEVPMKTAMHNNDRLNGSSCCLAGWVAGGQRVILPSHFQKCYLVTMERKWSYLAMIKGSPYGRNIRPAPGCSHCRCSTLLDCRTHCIKACWPHRETSQAVQHFHSLCCSPFNSSCMLGNTVPGIWEFLFVRLARITCSHRG